MEKPAITRINGGFEIVANPKSNENKGFYLPQVTTAQKDAIQPLRGVMVYELNTTSYQVKENGVWFKLSHIPASVTGDGLAPGTSPIVFPSGLRAEVELVGNQTNGFTYYDITNTVLRSYVNGAWVTVTTV